MFLCRSMSLNRLAPTPPLVWLSRLLLKLLDGEPERFTVYGLGFRVQGLGFRF